MLTRHGQVHAGGANVRRTTALSPSPAAAEPHPEPRQPTRRHATPSVSTPARSSMRSTSPRAPVHRAVAERSRSPSPEARPTPKRAAAARTPASGARPSVAGRRATPYSATPRKVVNPYDSSSVVAPQPTISLKFGDPHAPELLSGSAHAELPRQTAVESAPVAERGLQWLRSRLFLLSLAFVLAAAVIGSLPLVLNRVRYCDTNSTTIIGTANRAPSSWCSPCPSMATCAAGVARCATGFVAERKVRLRDVSLQTRCVHDNSIKAAGASVAASVASALKRARGSNMCFLSGAVEATINATTLQHRFVNANMTERDALIWNAAFQVLQQDRCIDITGIAANLSSTNFTAVCDEVRWLVPPLARAARLLILFVCLCGASGAALVVLLVLRVDCAVAHCVCGASLGRARVASAALALAPRVAPDRERGCESLRLGRADVATP